MESALASLLEARERGAKQMTFIFIGINLSHLFLPDSWVTDLIKLLLIRLRKSDNQVNWASFLDSKSRHFNSTFS